MSSDIRHHGTTLRDSLPLLATYITQETLSFHQRDPQRIAERVDGQTLVKGMAWRGQPARLSIRLLETRADIELAIDGKAGDDDAHALRRLVHRMLGLTQRIEDFEAAWREHPQLGRLIERHPGLRVPLAATPFEALTWAVTGQQISVGAAVSLRRKLIQASGLIHSEGLACYPDAPRLAQLSVADLRAAGFSSTKANTLLALSRQVEDGQLPLDEWAGTLPVEEMRTRLLAVRGIGPWTVNYTLLRGFGWLDGSLHGDAAVRRGLQLLIGSGEAPSAEETRSWLAPFEPWRALVAAHLWRLQTPAGY